MANKKYRRGFTASTFDLMHAGLVLMLKEAKGGCEHLTVGLHRDILKEDMEYRFREKGQLKNRPIMSVEERRILLEGSKYVDKIIEYTTEKELYEILKNGDFDVRIIGADWQGKNFTGSDLNIPLYFNSRDHDYSTSSLRRRIYESELEKIKKPN